MQDWRQAVRMPISYRVGNSTLRVQTQFVTVVGVIGILLLFALYITMPFSKGGGYPLTSNILGHNEHGHSHLVSDRKVSWVYNSTYPLSPPQKLGRGAIRYRIAIVTDLDTRSKLSDTENVWISYLLKGYLTYSAASNSIEVTWDNDHVVLKSSNALGGRGMELSELVAYNGRLYTVDDRTGIVFELSEDKPIPWVILTDGNGRSPQGFKCEWATVKDEHLYVGGLGKEWTTADGELVHFNPQWVKRISPVGQVTHLDWRHHYLTLRKTAGIDFPGYVIHESAAWSKVHLQWFFLPRRASVNRYNEIEDEKQGTNLMFRTDENFSDVRLKTVGPIIPTHGFSSFKFLPWTDDRIIVAIKSEEYRGNVSSYILAFSIDGDILLPETKIGNYKYEGIEFI